MKQIFTLLAFIGSFFIHQTATSQCNISSGANGISTGFSNPITIDGNMSDWGTYLSDPDNNSYDNTLGVDLDGPISDAGRDLTRFTFTEDANYLYIYLQRAGSTNNTVDMLFYADINDNGLMDLKEPVIHLNWSGSTGNVGISIREYQPSPLGSSANSVTVNMDGSMLKGTVAYRGSAPLANGRGASNGESLEAKIPFSLLTQLNNSGAVINQLTAGQNFKFHVSTINGQVSSVPGVNSINDNFGGCLVAPPVFITLPVKLLSFQGSLNNNKVQLQWSVAENETGDYFEVEKSTDGNNFKNIGVVFTSNETGTEIYAFKEGSELASTSYYRLKIVNKNGSSNYSKIVSLKNEKAIAGNSLVVLHNQGPSVTLNYTASKAGVYKINIYNISGAKLFASGITMQSGLNAASLKVDGLTSGGVYVLEVTNGIDRNVTRFIK